MPGAGPGETVTRQGRPDVCEQCRLDNADGAGANLTQAVATVELTRGGVCDWCGAPLLQEQEDPD